MFEFYHKISFACGIQKTKPMNKQESRIRPIDTENKLTVVGEGGMVGRWAKWAKGSRRYRLLVID